MDINELWEKTCILLKDELNEISYRTFIDRNLSPVRIEGDIIYIRMVMSSLEPVITQRFVPTIERLLQQTAGRKLLVCFLKGDEKENTVPVIQETENSVRLDDRYTFDTFVVGSGNRFAHAAALAVAQAPATTYNPLFIHGGVGLGKTHLMHAIGHYIHKEFPQKKLVYVNCETFTNELISSIQQGNNIAFRNRYRNADILMIDDIQFIGGKDATQEEFFNTFNTLHGAGKQIVLTCDRPPQAIAHLEERLRSRFTWGLICDIQRPDLETRIAILRARAEREGIEVDDSVLQMIAASVDSNIRELEGSLTRVIAYSRLVKEPITDALCRTALKEVLDRRANRTITADAVIQTVAGYYSLTALDLTSQNRRREIAIPRQIAIYLTRELTGMSLPQIGTAFNRDHTTVLHSIAKITAEMNGGDSRLASQVTDLRQMIQDTN